MERTLNLDPQVMSSNTNRLPEDFSSLKCYVSNIRYVLSNKKTDMKLNQKNQRLVNTFTALGSLGPFQGHHTPKVISDLTQAIKNEPLTQSSII